MPVANAVAAATSRRPTTVARVVDLSRERLFYLIATLILCGLVAAGFRHFYLSGRNVFGQPLAPQIAWLLIVHGGLMTAWMAVFLAQSALVVGRRMRTHMALGTAAAVLYGLIVPLGLAVAFATVHFAPESAHPPFGPERFLVIPLTDILGFALMAGLGLLYRRKPAVHRALMLTGTLMVCHAGIARIPLLGQLFAGFGRDVFFPFFWGATLGVGAVLVLLKLAMTRRWDRVFAGCYLAVVVAAVASSCVAGTAWWLRLASLVRP